MEGGEATVSSRLYRLLLPLLSVACTTACLFCTGQGTPHGASQAPASPVSCTSGDVPEGISEGILSQSLAWVVKLVAAELAPLASVPSRKEESERRVLTEGRTREGPAGAKHSGQEEGYCT